MLKYKLLLAIVLALGGTITYNNLKSAPTYSILEFGASWCPSCVKMQPLWQTKEVLAKLKEKQIEFFEINVDKQPEYVKLYKVGVIPAVILVETVDGETTEVRRFVGYRDKQTILKFLD